MASRNFPKKVKISQAIESIKRKCVFFNNSESEINNFEEMFDWCYHNIGFQRKKHPLIEVRQGWINNYVDEYWACSYMVDTDNYAFWFDRKEDRISFTLTFK